MTRASVCACTTATVVLTGTLAAAVAFGAATSTPATAIAGTALLAFSATFCTCDGAACLPFRLIFRGRRCRGDAFTDFPRSFHAWRMIRVMASAATLVPGGRDQSALDGPRCKAVTHSLQPLTSGYGPRDRSVQMEGRRNRPVMSSAPIPLARHRTGPDPATAPHPAGRWP